MTWREIEALLYCVGYVRQHATASAIPLPDPAEALARADIASTAAMFLIHASDEDWNDA